MGRIFSALLCGFVWLLAPWQSAQALDSDFARDVILEENTDYYGFDLETRKEISLDECQAACVGMQSCRAFTYNEKARFCFLKSDFGEKTPFDGATSGRVVMRATEPDLGVAPTLSHLAESWQYGANELRKDLPASVSGGFEELLAEGRSELGFDNATVAIARFEGALSLRPESSQAWLALSTAASRLSQISKDSAEQRRARSKAVSAAYNAYGTSRTRSARADALARLARSLEDASWFREALDTYKLALDLDENPATRADFQSLLQSHGFRMLTHSINADINTPRICLQFSEPLKKDYADFASFIRVDQQPPQSLDISDKQICVEGLAHGRSYAVDVREGLPAENGERLLANIQLDVYVRDRAPGMRFTGNNYVLPASNRRGIPLVSVNADEAKLSLYRVSDRSLAQLMRESRFMQQMDVWEVSGLVDYLGAPVWNGTIDIEPKHNEEVITSIPIDEALPERKPGVYLLTADQTQRDLKDYSSLASQWFVISDIGLTTFTANMASAEGAAGLEVYARSLETAKPMAGVAVELIARNNEILGTGTTDDDGLVRFDAGLVRGVDGLAPAVLTASKDEGDFVFLDLTRAGFDLSDRGVTGRPSPSGVDVYTWTERGVYRPGEEVHLSALARDGDAEAVDDLPLTFVVRRPDGVEAQRLVGSGAPLGGYAVSLPLTTNARRGTWRASVYADPDKPALAETSFLVEDFIPDRTDMTVEPNSETIAVGQEASGTIEGRFLYGAPADGLSVGGTLMVRESRSRKGFDGYVFGLAEEDSAGVERFPLDPMPPLDADGQGTYSFALGTLRASTRPKVADLVMKLVESSGRAIERQVRYQVKPNDTMIGIKPRFEDGQVSENTEAGFDLIAVAPDGTRTTRQDVDWSLVEIERHYQWYREGSRWNYEAVDMETLVADGTVSLGTDDPASLSVPVEWGHYRLTVGDATSLEFDAGWSSVAGSADTPDGLDLSLDKEHYAVGDTAKLKISPRFAGTLLLAIGTDSIRETRSLEIPAEGATIDIPVRQDWGAGAYLLANLYRPADLGSSRNPMRAIGVQWLGVEPGERALDISFAAPKWARPHDRLVVPVTVEGLKAGEEAYVQVAIVDEGILNLTNYQTPDPVGRYFGQRRLGLEIRDLYGKLIDGSLGAFGTLRTGGDGMGGEMQSEGDVPTQELVAFTSGIVRLDDAGKAEVAFDIPQFNGTARVMATAWTKSALGSGDEDTVIRDPIVVQVSLPKVLAPGDTSRALIELTNLDAPEGDYKLDVLTGDALSLDAADVPSSVTLARDDRVMLSLPVTASTIGIGEMTVKLASASGDGVGVLYNAMVPVRSGILPVTKVETVALSAGDGQLTLDEDLLAGFRKGDARVSVSVAEEGTYDVASLLMQLDRYPYGCAEQITSRALPLLYAKDIALSLPQELATLSGQEMEERLQKSVDRLLSYQSDIGGFSLWGNGIDDPWLSAYVTDFLTRARERGLNVPADAMERALTSLRNRLAYQSDLDRDSGSLAYGFYVLARNRQASAGDLRYYVDTQLDAFRTPLGRAQLGAALALYGDRTRAERAFNAALELASRQALLEEGVPLEDSYNFASIRRDVAGMLALGSEISPPLDSLSGIRSLARSLYDPERRLNTQEQTWMVMAARSRLANPPELGIVLDGEPVTGPLSLSLDAEQLATAPVSITNTGDQPLVAQITTLAAPLDPLPAGGNGFAISRSYHHLDGTPANTADVAQNERLVVVLSVKQLNDLPSRVMISDLLPAGLEIENPHLVKSADLANFQWLPQSTVANVEFRSDRMLAAVDHDIGGKSDWTLAYTVRAVTPGSYMHPAAVVEDMYRPEFAARSASGWMTVTER